MFSDEDKRANDEDKSSGNALKSVDAVDKSVEEEKRNEEEKRGDVAKAISFFGRFGFTVVACILLAVLLGNFLDNWLGTSPWFVLIFTFLGIGAAFKSIFDMAK